MLDHREVSSQIRAENNGSYQYSLYHIFGEKNTDLRFAQLCRVFHFFSQLSAASSFPIVSMPRASVKGEKLQVIGFSNGIWDDISYLTGWSVVSGRWSANVRIKQHLSGLSRSLKKKTNYKKLIQLISIDALVSIHLCSYMHNELSQ